MELNVPTPTTISRESPAVVQLHEDTQVPISEIKAKLHDKIMELNQKRLQTPTEVPYGHSTEDMREQCYKEVEDELKHPEEQEMTPEAEEYQDIFGDEAPGADAFAAPNDMGGDSFGGDMGGGFGGGFGGGIDNADMGFGDEDMATLNDTAENSFDEFTSEEGTEDASDVNNMSADEPGAPEEDTGEETQPQDEPPAE